MNVLARCERLLTGSLAVEPPTAFVLVPDADLRALMAVARAAIAVVRSPAYQGVSDEDVMLEEAVRRMAADGLRSSVQ
jgi:hypothetical protein